MIRTLKLIAGAAAVVLAAPPCAWAGGGIADVEGARAQERSGRGLTRQEIDSLDRYGGNDDGYTSGYGFGYGGPPAVGIYVGPGYGPGPGYGYGPPPYHEGPYDDED